MSRTDQLPSSDFSPETSEDDVHIKHYAQCSAVRHENEATTPYARTPVIEFKSSSSMESNPDQTPTKQISMSSPILNRQRKIGRQYSRYRVSRQADKAGGDADDGTESGKPAHPVTPKVCWTNAADQRGDAGAAIRTNDPDWPPTNGSVHCSERSRNSEDGKDTSRHVLAATAFVWLPLCRPTQKTSPDTKARLKSDVYYEEAQRCTRLKYRRNALADPRQMAMKQDVRERIQKEVEHRKASMTRKVSQYFKAIVSDDYEVDLV